MNFGPTQYFNVSECMACPQSIFCCPENIRAVPRLEAGLPQSLRFSHPVCLSRSGHTGPSGILTLAQTVPKRPAGFHSHPSKGYSFLTQPSTLKSNALSPLPLSIWPPKIPIHLLLLQTKTVSGAQPTVVELRTGF